MSEFNRYNHALSVVDEMLIEKTGNPCAFARVGSRVLINSIEDISCYNTVNILVLENKLLLRSARGHIDSLSLNDEELLAIVEWQHYN